MNITAQTISGLHQLDQALLATAQFVPMCHMEHDPSLGWRETPPMNSPTLQIRLKLHLGTYTAMNLPPPDTKSSVVNTKTTGVAE